MSSRKYWVINKWYLSFYIYRILIASVLFFNLIPGIQPADALNFNSGISSSYIDYDISLSSTYIILYLSILSNSIFGQYFSFILYTSIVSYTCIKLSENINFSKRYSLLTIFCLPTFSLFSVGLSKEFFIIIFISSFVIYIITKRNLLLLLFLLLVTIFIKPQVALIVICYFIFDKLKKLKNNLIDIRYLTIFSAFFIFTILFLKFSDELFVYLQIVKSHFSDDGNATRDIIFFENKYSYITSSIKGIYYLLFGPTIYEALNLKQGLLIFIENIYIISFIIYNTKKFDFTIINSSRIYLFFSIFFVSFLVIYPAAIYNFVSAIRYRIPILILLIFYFLYSKNNHEKKSFNIY